MPMVTLPKQSLPQADDWWDIKGLRECVALVREQVPVE